MNIKITRPELFQYLGFVTTRVNDLNYGAHVGHQIVYEYCHDARLAFLQAHNLSEVQFGEQSLVMASSAAQYFAEIFHPSKIKIQIALDDIKTHSFNLIYELTLADQEIKLARVQTCMVCFDKKNKKASAISKNILDKLNLLAQTQI